jgi:hypothetical protein
MFSMIGNMKIMLNEEPCHESQHLEHGIERWERNECEDMKTAIDYLYEFKKNLSNLHPVVVELISYMLSRQ